MARASEVLFSLLFFVFYPPSDFSMCLPKFAYAAREEAEDQAKIERLSIRAAAYEASIATLVNETIPLLNERLDKSRHEQVRAIKANEGSMHGSTPEARRERHELGSWLILLRSQRSQLMNELYDAEANLNDKVEELGDLHDELDELNKLSVRRQFMAHLPLLPLEN